MKRAKKKVAAKTKKKAPPPREPIKRTRQARPKWGGDLCRPEKRELVAACLKFKIVVVGARRKPVSPNGLPRKALHDQLSSRPDWDELNLWVWLRRIVGPRLARKKPLIKLTRIAYKKSPDKFWNACYE
jgi:hypothetical protein